jgi:hypothetical protein
MNIERKLPIVAPETALAILASLIGTSRWEPFLDLLRVLLAKDGKQIVDEMMTPKQFAQRTKVCEDIARKEFNSKPTVRIGRSRRMTESTFRKYYLEKEA